MNDQVWVSSEELKRINNFNKQLALYTGDHELVFSHPYSNKIEEFNENIPYYSNNILGKATDAFADLIIDTGITLTSTNPDFQKLFNDENNIKTINLSEIVSQALILSSFSGFAGFQPYIKTDTDIDLLCLPASNLIISMSSNNKIEYIQKFNIFVIENINILYMETHFPNYYEISGGEIQGNKYIKKYSFEHLKEILKDYVPELQTLTASIVEHNLQEFLISIVFSKVLLQKYYSDYSPSTIQLQKGLNDRETMMARILDQHSNPKLMAPRSFAKQDPLTGQWNYQIKDKEIIFLETEQEAKLFSYLTWEGQLEAAKEQRDHLILAICNNIGISPVLLDFTNLVSSTSADTSSKLRRMMRKTLSIANKKAFFVKQALISSLQNLQKLLNLPGKFQVIFSPIYADTFEELLEKIITKLQNKLISHKKAIQESNGVSEEEAFKIYNEILLEDQQPLENPIKENAYSNFIPITEKEETSDFIPITEKEETYEE